jgi:hypothetical protein
MSVGSLVLQADVLAFGSRGVSDEARATDGLSSWRAGMVADVVACVDGPRHALVDVHDAFQECSRADWDGGGALAVNPSTCAQAVRFLLNLPTMLPGPEVTVEPDGEIAFEWFRSGDRAFVVSISENGALNYTFRSGRRKAWGVAPLTDQIPREVLHWIWETVA